MNPDDFQKEVDSNKAAQDAVAGEQDKKKSIDSARDAVVGAVVASTKANMRHRANTTTKVDVQNDVAETQDINRAIEAINNLALIQFSNAQAAPAVNIDIGSQFNDLSEKITTLLEAVKNDASKDNNSELVGKLDTFITQLKTLQVAPDPDLKKSLAKIEAALGNLDVSPKITVPKPQVTIQGKDVDLSPLETLLQNIETTLKKLPQKNVDNKEVVKAVSKVYNAIAGLTFPVANYTLPFKDVNGRDTQVILDASGNVPISGGAGGSSGTQYAESATTSPATGTVALGRYKTTPPTLTDGQLNSLQLDARGNLKVGVADSLGNSTSSTPYGRLSVETNPHQIFYDTFDGTLDATERWTTPTVGNSAALASSAAGLMTLGTGTTASGWSKLTSQGSFIPTVPGWIGYSFLNLFPDLAAPTANSYRFWGAGTIAATPTTAAPMTDAVGFEINTAGKMFAVVYTAGTRTAIQDLSTSGNSTQPTDALLHRYIVKIRTDKTYFYIDGESSAQLVATYTATTGTSGPSVQTLPISFVAVGGATPPASNTQIQSLGAVVWDASQNNNTISDGTYQWRKAAVLSTKAQSVANETNSVAVNGIQATPKFATIAASSSGNNTIVAAVTGKKIRVLAAQLTANGAVNAKWQSGASGTDITGLAYLTTNTGMVLSYNPVGWFETAAATLLNLNLSGAIAVGGSITYLEV